MIVCKIDPYPRILQRYTLIMQGTLLDQKDALISAMNQPLVFYYKHHQNMEFCDVFEPLFQTIFGCINTN